jgi:hypothetical protein
MEKNKGTISKKDMLFERDEKGELIPQEVELELTDDILAVNPELEEYKGMKVWVTPITRGALKRLFAKTGMDNSDETDDSKDYEMGNDYDAQLVLKYCHKPSFEKEDLPYLKPGFVSALVNTIFKASGLHSGVGSKQNKIEKAETDFKKN